MRVCVGGGDARLIYFRHPRVSGPTAWTFVVRILYLYNIIMYLRHNILYIKTVHLDDNFLSDLDEVCLCVVFGGFCKFYRIYVRI